MVWTPERTAVNQRIQIGAESTTALGTNVSAGKLVECFDVFFGPNGDTKFYNPTGRKYATEQEQGTEWVDGNWTGMLDYNGIIYPLGGVFGAASAVAHGVSVTAKDWVFTPPVTGSIVPQTYTVEQGDSTYAHKVNYLLFNDFGYTLTRKDTKVTMKSISLPLQTGIAMTNSPTAVVLAPAPGKHINIYLDAASGSLGTTQLNKVLQVQFAFSNIYGPFFPLSRTTLGFSAHVDLLPKPTVKILLEADSVGMSPLAYWEAGTTYFLRVNAQGTVIDNLQTVSLGSPSAGTFTLTYKGQTTSGIAYNASAAAVQSALTGLSTVGSGNATVSGSAGGPYSVNFVGALAQDTTAMTGSGAGLTGGTFSITQNQTYNVFQHDMALKFDKPTQFSDQSGIFAIEWNAQVVEDSTWGKAQTATVTNLIAAL